MTVRIIPNAVTSEESKLIIKDLLDLHPEIAQSSHHLELSDAFGYLDYIPAIHIENLDRLIGRYAVSVIGQGWYAGDQWHEDGSKDEVTALLYLQGDNLCGGDLLTETTNNQFELNSLFVFNSSVSHYVTPYTSDLPRIAFKWRYKIKVDQLLGPLFY